LRDEVRERAADSEKFRALFEYSSDAHLILGEAGILDCNAAAIAMLRADSKEQVLRVHPAVLSPEVQPDGRRSLEKSVEMDRTAYERGSHTFEWMHRRMTGEDFPVEVTLTPVVLPGEARVLLVAWHELTLRKQREAALEAQLAVIVRQQEEIRRLSLPVLAVLDGVMMIPVLGELEPAGVERLMEAALAAAKRARVLILDLTGLARIDVVAAAGLVRVLGAIRLIGAEGIIVGVGPALAAAMVAADALLPRVRVLATLRDAIEACAGRGGLRSGPRS
jgi:PAS domain S-box-containing protein